MPSGWTIQKGTKDGNYWEVVNSRFPSAGYKSPDASGGCHIKIDGSSTYYDYLFSPVIDCSNYTKGVLKFGVWRSVTNDKSLYIYLDLNGDNVFSECRFIVFPDSIPKTEEWVLYTVNLKDTINHRPKVRIKFCLSPYGKIRETPYGPLRIDDITLYAFTTTLPTDHFRTKASGNWNSTAVWESSRDSVNWMPSTLVPDYKSSSIAIDSADTVLINAPLTADELIIKDSGTLTLAHDLILNNGTGDDLLVEEGGTLNLSTYYVTTAGTIQVNGRFKTANPEGLCGTTTASINNGTTLNPPGPNAVIEYNAKGTQVISPQPLYSNLVISGSGNKLLADSTTVSHHLKIDNGFLLLNAYNLVVGDSVTGTPTSYVKLNGSGKLTIKNVGSIPKTFPIGNTSYNPVVISNGSGLDWTVGVEDAWVPSEAVLGTSGDKSIHRTWSVAPSTNPPPAASDIRFFYNDDDTAQAGNGFNRAVPIIVWRQAEDSWLIVGEPRYPDSSENGKAAAIACDRLFSLFAISNVDMPMPIRFRNVVARQEQHSVIVSFTNETESGVEEYTLERSVDEQTYKFIKVIHPLKNDGTSVSYETSDAAPAETLNFYRIRGREKGGKDTFSPVVQVNLKETDARITIIPNPAHKGTITVQLTNVSQDHYAVRIYDVEGKVVQHHTLHHPGGSANFVLRAEGLRPGTYVLELAGKEKLLQRFVVL